MNRVPTQHPLAIGPHANFSDIDGKAAAGLDFRHNFSVARRRNVGGNAC
jgi:hypothetical protein